MPNRGDPWLLHGANVLGRLLMRLRDVVTTVDAAVWQLVPSPPIPDFLLDGRPVRTVTSATRGN